MKEPGQVAYEARFADQPSSAKAWALQDDGVRAVWVRVERAVLQGAHRLQVIRDAWDDDVTITIAANPALAPEASRALLAVADATVELIRQPPPTPAPDRTVARSLGFTGNTCSNCGAFAMVRTGTCETCQACSATSGGCS